MGQHVPPYEALYVLSQERRLKNRALEDDVVGKYESHKVFVASHIRGGRSVDVGYTNGVKAKLSGQTLPHDAASGASVDHADGGNWRRNGSSGGPKRRLDWAPNRKSNFNNGTDRLKVRYLGGE